MVKILNSPSKVLYLTQFELRQRVRKNASNTLYYKNMLNCICIIKFLPVSVVLLWSVVVREPFKYLDPGSIPSCKLFCLVGKDLFFSSVFLKKEI